MNTYATREEMYAAEFPPNGIGCEVGVFFGDNAAALLEHATPRELHLVDPWALLPGYEGQAHEAQISHVQTRFKDDIRVGRVILHVGTSAAILPTLPAIFDWVYLDGDHRYPAVSGDLEKAASILKPGGIIAGHDYAPHDDWETGLIGVFEAVRDFSFTTHWKVVATTNDSFCLRKEQ